MTDFEQPIHSNVDMGVNLPTVPPILSELLLSELHLETWQQLEFWSHYRHAEIATKALIRNIVQTNLDNVTKHVKRVDNRDVRNDDINRIARGLRPQGVFLFPESEGVDSVELMARLVSDQEEPHNALSTVMAERALQCVLQDEEWRKPFGDNPRSRLKITRLFPMIDPEYAVVQTKLDHADIETVNQADRQFLVKGRRSGYMALDELPGEVRAGVVMLSDLHHNGIPDAETSKNIVAEYLQDNPLNYRAVIDRAYAARRVDVPKN